MLQSPSAHAVPDARCSRFGQFRSRILIGMSFILATGQFPAVALAQSTIPTQNLVGGEGLYAIGQLFTASKWDDALESLNKQIETQPKTETPFYQLARAIVLSEKKQHDKALEILEPLKGKSLLWDDYVNLLSAQAELQLGKKKEARESAQKIKQSATTRKLYNDAQLVLGDLALEEGRFGDARTIYLGLEKRVRREPDYPKVLLNLAIAERGLSRTREFCQRVTRLYRDFPDAEQVRAWGPFLDENPVAGKASLCSFRWEDLLDRARNLHLAGFVDRVRSEIDQVKNRAQGQKSFEVDRLEAQFFLQEGEVSQALALLSPYYQSRKQDLNYLSVVAAAASRAGDSSTAIGAYLNINKLTPKTQKGRQALFQAAFLSYQYQDYDGAMRRFAQFLETNKATGLGIDAQWHMAWIHYLKGNFAKSYRELADLRDRLQKQRRRTRTQTTERIEYWMAMSQLRLKNLEDARGLFENVVRGGGEGYYAIAARGRMKQIDTLQPKRVARWVMTPGTETRRPAAFQPILQAFDNSELWAQASPKIDPDSEDAILMGPKGTGVTTETAEEMSMSEENIAGVSDQKAVDVSDEGGGISSSPNPVIVQRFERARRLIALGLVELAKWELYEIERKTLNKDYLRELVSEYERIDQFHRSSTIATNNFADQRGLGIEQQKMLWEKAYPEAYKKAVLKSSKDFDVPKEMVWAIMRAESNYRKEALSPVGALGLMQVMPKTGQKISEMLGDKSFEARALLEPPTAIRVGTRYLQRLSRTLEANRALMAAGYNAGPHRVKTWLQRFGNLDLDEFIEHIPFLETRNYVKKVVSNYQVYSHVYESKTDVFPELTQAIPIRILEPVPMKETWEDI